MSGTASISLDLDSSKASTGYETTFTEGSAAVAVSFGAVISDPGVGSDDANLIRSLSIKFDTTTIGYVYQAGSDNLLFDASLYGASGTASLVAVWSTTTNTLTFTPRKGNTESKFAFETALNSIKFENTSEAPVTGTRGLLVTVVDDGGGSDTIRSDVEVTTVNIQGVNDAPSGKDKSITIQEDGSYTFTTADFGFSDVDGNTLAAVKITTLPTAGTLKLDNVAVTEGQLITAANLGKLTFVPMANANGPAYASFTFQVQDNGGIANSGVDLDPTPNQITLNVTGINDAPTAVLLTNNKVDENSVAGTVVGTLSATDADVGDTHTFALVAGAGDTDNGKFTIDAVTKSLKLNFVPDFETKSNYSIRVKATDSAGAATEQVLTVNISDLVENRAPAPVDDLGAAGFVAIEGGSAAVGDVLTNDSDPDGDTLQVTGFKVGATDYAAGTTATLANGATLSVAVDGTVTLTQNGKFDVLPAGATSDSIAFSYTVSDRAAGVAEALTATANAAVTVTGANDQAAISGTTSGALTEDAAASTASGALAVADPDAGENVFQALAPAALVGTYGDFTFNAATGAWAYTLDNARTAVQALAAGEVKADTLTVTSKDGSDSETITVKVTGVNDAPVAGTVAAVSTNEDTPSAAIDVVAAGTDVENQALSVAGGADAPTALHGTVAVDAQGRLVYTPNANFFGADTITYKLTDGSALSQAATVAITVNPVNDAPTATAAPAQGDEDLAITGSVVGADVDKDLLTYKLAANGAPQHGTVTLKADGSYSYQGAKDYNGPDAFTVEVSDGNGGTTTATVNVTVNPVNDAPTADPTSFAVDEDATYKGALVGADVDVGDTFTFVKVVGPTNGTLTLSADGTFEYSPTANYHGADSFTFRTKDASGALSAVQTALITVNSVNDDPTNAAIGTAAAITVDETTLGTSSSANYAVNFAADFGGDGPGAKSYSLQATDGAATNLVTSAGDPVKLKVIAGGTEVQGVLADGLTRVFTATINSAGTVTLTQHMAVKQGTAGNANESISLTAGLIKVVSKVTDSDTGVAIAMLDLPLAFLDDGPSLTSKAGATAPTLTSKDEDASEGVLATQSYAAMFDPKFGADGGAMSYKLVVANAASGLTSINNKAITLTTDGTVVTGTEVSGNVAFTLTLNAATGEITLDQKLAMKHGAAQPSVSLASGAVQIEGIATDRDGDATSPVRADVKASFVDAAPTFVGWDTTLEMQFKNLASKSFNLNVDYGHDIPGGPVTFGSYAEESNNGLIARMNGGVLEYARSDDLNVKAVFRIDLKDADPGVGVAYNVGVPFAPKGLVQQIAFDKIPAGSSRETITAALTGSYGGSITINGLLADGKGVLTDPGAKSTNDDINPNSIGFGIRGGQASQINPGEAFKVTYNSPGSGDLNHLTHLSFDVYGIGNIENVTVKYELYRFGMNGEAVLIDTGSRTTANALDEYGAVSKTGLKLTDGLAHNIDLFDDGNKVGDAPGGSAGVDAGVGDYFDYAIVSFDFPKNAKGVVDPNQGIRVGTFFTEIIKTPDPDWITFELQAADADGDIGLSGSTRMDFKPDLLFS
ncbi:Ig-like domain-containing protein [Sabulicella rubraurantiaca]|uniref:Ig-like domain-containing protein n=1 Tax=Sabulicella rubraurantiaca TaxID=2811429 RepID=UPI001A979D6F|nr:Ig-like domain-containing protein [Sabulicella rubraurantiaca]